ncbi:hypothetical protein ACFXGA_06270 [Actinosynnema sp. NPDC059335]|uniref:hypothetical protein n=1 Tax=Actinosynnema sp. NPDC059335 TaxID=3346804 RepID=UPI00366E6B9A
MPWKPIPAPTTLDLTDEKVFVEAGQPVAGGRWHLLRDGTVVHENDAGNWQTSMHDADALNDPNRFIPVP